MTERMKSCNKTQNTSAQGIAIIDYGMGNLFSIAKALENIQIPFEIITEQKTLSRFDFAILPGVGAFSDGMANLHNGQWIEAIKKFSETKALLGICLGMQLLMDQGIENTLTQGLGIISGTVTKLSTPATVRLPHIGWNELNQNCEDAIFKQIKQHEDFYFVHSYYCQVADPCTSIGTSVYGESFTSVCKKRRTVGVQFHPEKSGLAGQQLLKNFYWDI